MKEGGGSSDEVSIKDVVDTKFMKKYPDLDPKLLYDLPTKFKSYYKLNQTLKKEGDDEEVSEDKKTCSPKYKDSIVGLAKRFKQKGGEEDKNNKKIDKEEEEEKEKNAIQQPKDPKAIAAF